MTSLVSVAQTKVDNLDVLVVIEKKVLGLEVPVNYVELVEVFYASNDLVEEFEGRGLFYPLVLDDVVEKLASVRILHDQVELLWGLDDFIKLNDVRVSDHF